MHTRPVVALSVIGVLAVTGIAQAAPKQPAAPKPVCNLITDATGDGKVAVPAADLDIVSGDLATNAKTITAVLRLAGDPTARNPQALGGKNYYVTFNAPGVAEQQFLSAQIDPVLGATYSTGFTDTATGVGARTDDATPATGSIAGNVITIQAPLSAFASRTTFPAGKRLSGLGAEVFVLVGTGPTGGLLIRADDALGASYPIGASSCVKQ